jgi:hypothetical protein
VPKDNTNIKRYIAIVKIRNNNDGTANCVKYRFDNLVLFTRFLDNKFPEWKWYNVYSNKGENKGLQLGNYTKNKRPVTSSII